MDKVTFFMGCKGTNVVHLGYAFLEMDYNKVCELESKMSECTPNKLPPGQLYSVKEHPEWEHLSPTHWSLDERELQKDKIENVFPEAHPLAHVKEKTGFLDEVLLVDPSFASRIDKSTYENVHVYPQTHLIYWSAQIEGYWASTLRIQRHDLIMAKLALAPVEELPPIIEDLLDRHPDRTLKLLREGLKILPRTCGRDIAPLLPADIIRPFFDPNMDRVTMAANILDRFGPASEDFQKELLNHPSRHVRTKAIQALKGRVRQR